MLAPPFFMAHFYNCEVISDPTFNPDIETPAQARKHRKVYPSVTTVLGIVKDAFLDSIYKPRMMAQLAREKPNLHWKDIERLTYGTREHPITGEMIESSQFGTTVHKVIEDHINYFWFQQGQHPEDTAWNKWAEPFVQWVEATGVKPISCERVVANNRIKIAGSVDFIGHDAEGKLFLADYKCRANTKGKAKVYEKDCQQLAIEAWMLQMEHGLGYLPACRSVIVDCDTAEHMHHNWPKDDLIKGIKVAKKCAELYWLLRM